MQTLHGFGDEVYDFLVGWFGLFVACARLLSPGLGGVGVFWRSILFVLRQFLFKFLDLAVLVDCRIVVPRVFAGAAGEIHVAPTSAAWA